MQIIKKPALRYFGTYVGPETEEGYWDKANYRDFPIKPEFVVIHCTEGFEAGDIATLTGETKRRASSHYYITKKGVVYEFVSPTTRAWHAGGSRWKVGSREFEGFNNFSVGIELENRYVEDPVHGSTSYTESQFTALVGLYKSLQEKFPVLKDPQRVVRHSDISGFRGKTDPGPLFPWDGFLRQVFGSEVVGPPEFSVTVNGTLLAQRLILVEGVSYLPLRAVATALGLEVKWDARTKSVELVSIDKKPPA